MSSNQTSELIGQAAAAAKVIEFATTEQKNTFLKCFIEQLQQDCEQILAANCLDCKNAKQASLASHLVDRLELNQQRFEAMIDSIKAVANLEDPVGKLSELKITQAGYELAKMRVPLGLIGFIYEARPNVTADAVALCVKSGNAVVLRGGKEAWLTNQVMIESAQQALANSGLPASCVVHLTNPDHAETGVLIADCRLSLIIPRGGPELVKRVNREAKVPVLSHEQGNNHLYVDAKADLAMASQLAYNAKVVRPATCNALEKLLVHANVADEFVPAIVAKLQEASVAIVGCAKTVALIGKDCTQATDDDWYNEYLDLKIAIKIVDSFEMAVSHINQYGSAHTDSICTSDPTVADKFLRVVDSSSVMVNLSTRFADGFEYGLGAEVGIATGNLYARGPVGLEGLTTQKWIARGTGQIRE